MSAIDRDRALSPRAPGAGTAARRACLLVTGAAVCWLGNAVWGATNDFQRQLLTLPFSANSSRFVVLDESGRAALLAVDPARKQLLVYRQREWGFTNAADQVIALPPQTAWVAPADVDTNAGLELVLSTAKGLFYFRQNEGRFESELRTLVARDQVFTNDDAPWLFSLATNRELPIVQATQAVMYARTGEYEWRAGEPLALTHQRASGWTKRSQWDFGPNPAQRLVVQQTLQARPDRREGSPANEAIRKLVEQLKERDPQLLGTNCVDLNRDGRTDFVLWQFIPGLDPRTDVYVFLRNTDDQLPERPNQVLHCRGVPIPIDDTDEPSAIADLKHDGNYELVLVEFKTPVSSAGGVLEMFFSMGVNCALTVRAFHDGMFPAAPDTAIRATLGLMLQEVRHWTLFVCGDFNGDGRPDFVAQRSINQWNIYLSTGDAGWFSAEPAMTFDAPMPGYLEMGDLNGDRRSDIVLWNRDDPRVYIYLSQPRRAKMEPR